jgi:hypothetical protein
MSTTTLAAGDVFCSFSGGVDGVDQVGGERSLLAVDRQELDAGSRCRAGRQAGHGGTPSYQPAASMPVVKEPIACNLGAEAARRQLDEWRELLAQFPSSRLSPTQLSVRLAGSPPALAPVIALAQREKACCPFFDFSFQVEADVVVLRVSVPDDATSILDHFVRAT